MGLGPSTADFALAFAWRGNFLALGWVISSWRTEPRMELGPSTADFALGSTLDFGPSTADFALGIFLAICLDEGNNSFFFAFGTKWTFGLLDRFRLDRRHGGDDDDESDFAVGLRRCLAAEFILSMNSWYKGSSSTRAARDASSWEFAPPKFSSINLFTLSSL